MSGAVPPTRLLLVDDTADLRLLLRLAFESSGRYAVTAEAGDGIEALEAAEVHREGIDLIVLDLAMPRMDGLEALPRLRGLLPEVPVVVLSGFAADSTAEAALAAGAALYLEKGLRPDELIAAIEDADLGPTGTGARTIRAAPPGDTGGRDRVGDPPTHEVVAELAHDVRSPLFVAKEVVRVLRRSLDDPQLLHLADRAMAAVDRVDLTLGSAIEHARLGQAPLHRQRHELRGLLIEVTATLTEAESRRIRMRGPAVHAHTDRGACTRVLGNLLDNALRYSDGPVEVDTDLHEDGTACLTIRDHGPGLGEDAEALFAPFARGRAGRDAPGSGLGLATARRLVERSGGTLSGHEAPGGGALLRLHLPGA